MRYLPLVSLASFIFCHAALANTIKCQADYEVDNEFCKVAGFNCFSIFKINDDSKTLEKLSRSQPSKFRSLDIEKWSDESIVAVDQYYSSFLMSKDISNILYSKTAYSFDRYSGSLVETTRFFNDEKRQLNANELRGYDLSFTAKYSSENTKKSQCKSHEKQI